ncbi:hypothetical protein AA18890_0704 [Komagataeibacter europaeus LMG 18890]|nr:hypothetical protein AA18890_0704 [Komagataeibacter europaeus LMG 18890]
MQRLAAYGSRGGRYVRQALRGAPGRDFHLFGLWRVVFQMGDGKFPVLFVGRLGCGSGRT